MATLAAGSFRTESSPSRLSFAPAPRFLCGCRDCAFRREEMRLAAIVAMEEQRQTPLAANRMPVCEEA